MATPNRRKKEICSVTRPSHGGKKPSESGGKPLVAGSTVPVVAESLGRGLCLVVDVF